MKNITTTAPKGKKTITFYEACKFAGMDGADISDRDWDWGIFLGIPEAETIKECEDGYDRFCLLLALNLHCEGIVRDWYTPCDVCAFIEAHRKTFERFFNEENREGYRPMDYNSPKATEDKGYYEAFMQPMESLIAGNYTDEDYEKLVNLLLKE